VLLVSLRWKTALILVAVLIPIIGSLGFVLRGASLRIEQEARHQEGVILREKTLNDLRSREVELRQKAQHSFRFFREDPELLGDYASLCEDPKGACAISTDFALLMNSRGEILWQEGIPPGESLILPPQEALLHPPASEDTFLFGLRGERLFLLAGVSGFSSSGGGRDAERILLLGRDLATILPFASETTPKKDLPPLEYLPLFQEKNPLLPRSAFIVHEIEASKNPLLQRLSREERGYFLLRNWKGNPQALVSFSPRRDMAALVNQTLRIHYTLLFLLGGLLFGVLLFVLHRLVIQRLHSLGAFLQTLIQESRFTTSSQRMPLKGSDEISLLGEHINTLLDTLEEARREERQNEQQLLALANNIPGAVYRSRVDRQFSKIFMSENFEQLTGYKATDILESRRITITDIAHPNDRIYLLTTFWKQLEEEETFSIYYRILRSDGEYIWVHDNGQVTLDEATGERFIDGVILDMTELKKTEIRLQEEKSRYKELTDSLPQTIFETDLTGKIRFMNRNGFSSFGYLPRDLQERELSWLNLFEEDHKIVARRCMKRLFDEDREIATEITARTERGKTFPAALYINPVRQEGEICGMLGIIIDLSAQKTMEEKLRFLSMHDSLTGLYNRAFFEEEMQRMDSRRFDPLGVIMCDLDGLKLVNDIMGHASGDRLLIAAACILRQTFRSSDVIARIGGDEFAILLPQCPEEKMREILRRLQKNTEAYNSGAGSIPISISVGSACRESASQDIPQVSAETLMSEADSRMYRQKLRQSAQVRRNFVEKLHTNFCNASMLGSREHQHHARDLLVALWRHLGKSENEEAQVGLFALSHDIGYIGIPQEIVGKPGPLTEKEWEVVRRHPEIGHRIALSSPELAPVAELILKHHERPDGKGYPLELPGEEIPVACQLFALVDAYTCMINDRPFQKACSPEEAFEEIRRHKGTQFDATYTELFLEFMEQHPELQQYAAEETA
jgi:diguanylate cyclase (GGDEF)-like protein/PAS domain S-box-containing protein